MKKEEFEKIMKKLEEVEKKLDKMQKELDCIHLYGDVVGYVYTTPRNVQYTIGG